MAGPRPKAEASYQTRGCRRNPEAAVKQAEAPHHIFCIVDQHRALSHVFISAIGSL